MVIGADQCIYILIDGAFLPHGGYLREVVVVFVGSGEKRSLWRASFGGWPHHMETFPFHPVTIYTIGLGGSAGHFILLVVATLKLLSLFKEATHMVSIRIHTRRFRKRSIFKDELALGK